MEYNTLQKQVAAARQRLDTLRSRTEESTDHRDLLSEALEDLSNSLEELHVSAEALREQSEQVFAANAREAATAARYRNLFDHAPDAYLVTDVDGTIEEANLAAAQLLQIRREFLVGKPLDIYVAEEDRSPFRSRLAGLKAGDAQGGWELRVRPRSGAHLATILNVVADRDAQGRPVSLRWLIRDITDRKQAEEEELRQTNLRRRKALDELEATQHQVIQQERMRALGQMASGIAHDFNNSLSPVLGYSEILLEDPEVPERMRGLLELIHTGASDAAAVVERLQEFYRQGPPGPSRAVELSGLVRQVCLLTRPTWRDEAQRTGQTIDVRLDLSDRAVVSGNAAELREVLINLVLNAVDAMPSGGRLTIRVYTSDEFATLEVADTGTGMTEEVRARCFEPFFTTKGPAGSGLGLSVCHGIIQRHQGRIEIHSEEGIGTTFKVYFPLTSQHHTAETTGPLAALPRRRMLYIDDDPRVRSTVACMLQVLEQDVDLAESGPAGIEMFRAKPYDVVITDLGMPEVDGWAVTHAIKSIRQDVPVVMLTGWGSPREPAKAATLYKPNFIIGKPLTAAKLRESLEKIQEEIRTLN